MVDSIDWTKGFVLELFKAQRVSNLWTKRHLSQLQHVFYDRPAVEKILELEDPVIYEFQELGAPEHPGDLAFGISRVFPGKIGNEYYMTKGHFHNIRDTAEVYLCLEGQGILLTEHSNHACNPLKLVSMSAAYSAKGYAHRSINTGTEPLTTFFAFRADAGHDYGTIETQEFQNIVVEQNGRPVILPNPNQKHGI